MEKVHSFRLNVNGDQVVYGVWFDHELYHFIPESKAEAPTLKFKLENNHWTEQQKTDPKLKEQATTCLDQYLLSQH